ncbi:MAG: alpha-amylase [Phycisphaerales bacterium]|nr:MAG: alpha-amylase [Phycisphaerales bacterium]
MTAVVCYFQVHQPHRLRRFSAFDRGHDYFDDAQNAEICRKVADKCYRPATDLLLELVERHAGAFRVAMSLSGCVIDQLERFAPDALERFQRLAASGCCELLAETHDHTLSFPDDPDEFREQVERHTARVEACFHHRPRVFRNTELIYSNALARELSAWREPDASPRFIACLAEGVDRVLAGRTPNAVYAARPREARLALLLRNHRLSDDIAFRFANRAWDAWPLTPDKFAAWIDRLHDAGGTVCNLFMDYETFGEHQWRETGIFDFLRELPGAVLRSGRHKFRTPSEAVARAAPVGVYDCPELTSWADTERDLSAWRGNAMQAHAAARLESLGTELRRALQAHETPPADLLELRHDWRRLCTSDHVYYMATKRPDDDGVHAYFSPYDSPYDAYINLMNVLDSIESRLAAAAAS